jgi:hypothetical protein
LKKWEDGILQNLSTVLNPEDPLPIKCGLDRQTDWKFSNEEASKQQSLESRKVVEDGIMKEKQSETTMGNSEDK